MIGGHLVFAIATTAYILIAIQFEEIHPEQLPGQVRVECSLTRADVENILITAYAANGTGKFVRPLPRPI